MKKYFNVSQRPPGRYRGNIRYDIIRKTVRSKIATVIEGIVAGLSILATLHRPIGRARIPEIEDGIVMIVLSDAQNHKIVRTILLGGELKQTLNARIRNSKVLRQAVVDPHQHIMRTMMSQSWMGIATECER